MNLRKRRQFQGIVTGIILGIGAAPFTAHAQTQEIVPYDKVQVPEKVMAALDAARAGKDIWKPKFKSVSYTVVTSDSRLPGSDLAYRIDLQSQANGLLRANESFGADKFQKLSFGHLFSLKVQGVYESGMTTTTQTTLLVGSLPNKLEISTSFSIYTEYVRLPENEKLPVNTNTLSCKVEDIYAASTIYSTLTGNAIEMDCHGTRIFLEDLGIALSLPGRSETKNYLRSKIVRFEVEK
jgi:hypothetical protein